MGFFKKIFLFQLVGLVLTYNFSNCDFKKIRKDYSHVIFYDLQNYPSKSQSNSKPLPCSNLPDCLAKIERHTFNSTVCPPLSEEAFAWKTAATLARHCPGYVRAQINNTQKVQQKFNHNCLEQVSQILGWWRYFSRHSPK